MFEFHALWLLLFLAGVIAGVVNVMAGGGSSITLPLLILLGLDAGVANGTNRVAILVQNISAVLTFSHEKKTRLRTSFTLALWTIPGAITGALVATRIDDAVFEKILGGLLILIVLSMLIPRDSNPEEQGERQSLWTGPSLLAIGFYGGFIQVGVGFLLMAVLVHLMRLDLLTTTVHKITIVLIYMIPALFLYAVMGKIDWALGFVLATGNAIGAYIAAKMAIQRGEKIIKIVLMIAVLMMALRILGII
ncbi:MAG: sulfite exporter TauE/SafE family protein [Bacteroidetes bacterium]|nr:sulfite exporter TauE/SafE family protein [Bacteroidota bacterium]